MITEDLISIGLTPQEAEVYLAILELGGGYVSTIAQRAKVHRVTCYNTLSNLTKRGFVNFSSRNGVRFYLAEPPQVLFNPIEQKYSTAKKMLPILVALHRSSAFTPKIRYYEERENILSIFEDMSRAESEILGYTNLVPLQELFPYELERFGKTLVSKKMKARFLSPFDAENEACIKRFFSDAIKEQNLEILCVNPRQFPFKNGVFFYDNTTAIISYAKSELLGVIIESAVNTQTQKAMFDLAWLGATSFIVR